jgi:hypothetical protein
MKILTLALAAAALSAGGAVAAERDNVEARNTLVCRWEAAQQSGIPIRICMTRRQWAARTAYTQQWIREYQARSFVKM